MTHRRLRWRGWLALPLATAGLLVGQVSVAIPAHAGIVYERTFASTGQFALHAPLAVTTDPLGDVFVADSSGQQIVEFKSDGHGDRTFGLGDSSTVGTDGHLYYPSGIAYFDGKIYVADTGGNDIQIFDDSGNFVARWGSAGQGPGQFNSPDGVAVDCAGNVWVTNSRGPNGAGDVEELDSTGAFIKRFGNDKLAVPVGIAVDAVGTGSNCAPGNVWVADEYNGRIAQFGAGSGTFDQYIGSQGSGPMQFDHPDQLVLDFVPPYTDVLWVAESGNFRAQAIVSQNGGTQWSEGVIIDQGPNGHLNDSHGVTVDGQGNIIVAQTEGAQIYEYANVAPKLSFVLRSTNKNFVKNTSSLSYDVRYNQLGKECNVLVKSTITVPPNAAHRFTIQRDATGVDRTGAYVNPKLSAQQLKWMEQAWQAGRNITTDGKALASCSDNVHLTATWQRIIYH